MSLTSGGDGRQRTGDWMVDDGPVDDLEWGTELEPRWSVLEMLWPSTAMVPYDDSDGHLKRLREWLYDVTGFSVFQLTGPGGAGKTRTAVEICDEMGRAGWDVSFFPAGGGPATGSELARLVTTDRPRLVVVDDSNSRPGDVQMLVDALGEPWPKTRNRVRVLLCGRRGARHSSVRRRAGEALHHATTVRLENNFLRTGLDRQAHFDRAFGAFHNFLADTPDALPKMIDAPSLRDGRFGLPLYLQMAAAIAAVANLYKEDAHRSFADAATLMDVIIDLEDTYRWRHHRCPARLQLDGPPQVERRQLVALSSLLPARTRDEQRQVVSMITNFDVDSICNWLGDLYPLRGEPRVFRRLQPELINEHFIMNYLEPNTLEAAASWLANRNDVRAATSALDVFRLALSGPSGVRRELRPWLAQHLGAAWAYVSTAAEAHDLINPGGVRSVAGVLAALVSSDPEMAATAPELPANLPSPLHHLGSALQEREVQKLQASAERDGSRHLPALAMALNNLGIRYSTLGRDEDALVATQRAVEIYYDLAELQPERHNPHLAAALSNLAVRYSVLGRETDALAAAQQVVDLRTRILQTDPQRHRPDLAESLVSLAGHYRATGRYERALDTAQRAVDLYTLLCEENPRQYQPRLIAGVQLLDAILADMVKHRATQRKKTRRAPTNNGATSN